MLCLLFEHLTNGKIMEMQSFLLLYYAYLIAAHFRKLSLISFHINCKPYQSWHEPHELNFFKQNRVWETTFTPIKLGCPRQKAPV